MKKNMWVIFEKGDEVNKLISIIKARTGTIQIKKFVQQTWYDRFLTFNEKVGLLNKEDCFPYRAEVVGMNELRCGNRIICGEKCLQIWAIKSHEFEEHEKFIIFKYRLLMDLEDREFKTLECRVTT